MRAVYSQIIYSCLEEECGGMARRAFDSNILQQLSLMWAPGKRHDQGYPTGSTQLQGQPPPLLPHSVLTVLGPNLRDSSHMESQC